MNLKHVRLFWILAAAIAAVLFQRDLVAIEEDEPGNGDRVFTRSFLGPISEKSVTYSICLPKDYHEGGKHYAVIYHLHGAGGDHTSQNDIIIDSLYQAVAADLVPPVILVFPNGYDNSMWADSRDGSKPAETNVVWELIRHVDSTYRTLPSSEFRIIQGSSMGGYGAAALAAKYPELFNVCLMFDGALHDWDSLSERRKNIASEIFGNSESYYDRFSPWRNTSLNVGRIRHRVSYRMVVGALKEFNQEYRRHLEGLGLDVEYIQTGCDHNLPCLMQETNLQNFEFISQNSGLSSQSK